jgi:hypothetical protein
MTGVFFRPRARRTNAALLVLLLCFSLTPRGAAQEQQQQQQSANDAATPAASPASGTPKQFFRMETLRVGTDAELLTIFGRLDGLPADGTNADTPLVSILRDTLGDADPHNDRLRQVWMLTYTRPNAWQRVASAVPFLYARVGNKRRASRDEPPPPVLDLAATSRDTWRRFMWLGLQNLLFNPYGVFVKSSSNAFSRNERAFRQSHVIRALAVLSLYEATTGAPSALAPHELHQIQARLMLTDKVFGGIVGDDYVERYYHNQTVAWRDTRGHNWELLRQRAEAEGLYFEPLTLPDGDATHALLWVARTDLAKNRERKYSARFLNVSNPWRDRRLTKWRGHVATRYFDAENRPVESDAPGARAVEMIPLALYGLEHPKIPTLLVDFRDGGNPKRREMSHRLIEDVTRNVLAVSKFGDVHYFLGRTVFDFVTGRRGMDINQPSRLRAYAQLKLLLALNASLDPDLRDEINDRLERVSLNPLENDLDAEARLAREQYAALLDYARRPDGLAARLDRDRRAELVPLAHGKAERTLLRLANVISFGLYTHREDASAAEQRERLDDARRLAYHRRFLREVSRSSPLIEVVWNIEDVRRSLAFVAERGARAGKSTAGSAARIFAHTQDEETRRLCLQSLYRINDETAKNELLRIYQSAELTPELRLLCGEYLRKALQEEQRIAPSDARVIVSVVGR